MLFEFEFAERRHGIHGEDFVGRMVGIERERDRDQAANKMRVAVTAKMKARPVRRVHPRFALDPDLTYAASDPVGFIARGFVHRFEHAPELDHIAITIFPVRQEGEIVVAGRIPPGIFSSMSSRLIYRTRQFWNALPGHRKQVDTEALLPHLSPSQIVLFRRMDASEQAHAFQVFRAVEGNRADRCGLIGSSPSCTMSARYYFPSQYSTVW